jgi:predicted transcriptional regulator
MAQILEIAKEGTLKTQIMYKANLSFTQLNNYIQFMVMSNLIAHKTIEGKEVYFITVKGFNFLEMYCDLISLLRTETSSSEVKVSTKTRSKTKAHSRNVQEP